MRQNFAKEFGVRRWYSQEDETTLNESGEAADGEPLRKIVIAACLHNPYANKPFTPDHCADKPLRAMAKPASSEQRANTNTATPF